MSYWICYAVIIPNETGDGSRVSERILYLSPKKTLNDQVAIERVTQFRDQEDLVCKSLGRTFIMGDLVALERGRVRIVSLV